MIARWGGHAATAALVTPVTAAGVLDQPRMTAHVKDLLARGLDGVVPFGTTGEGASLSQRDKDASVEALLAAGVPAERLVVGIASSAAAAAADTIAWALSVGCAGVLLPPPFYYRGAAPSGVLAWYTTVIERVGGAARGIIPYNIPSVTGVPVPPAMVGELHRRFGTIIAAIKDSSGDRPTTEAFLALASVPVLVGHEGYLAAMVRQGAVGCISGLANIVPERLSRMVRSGDEDAAFAPAVDAVCALPVVPAVRAVLAHVTGDAAWARPLPPLEQLSDAEAAGLVARWDQLMSR